MLRLAACALLACALPAAAQEKAPAVVFQARTPAALLAHVRVAALALGDKPMAAEFQEWLDETFGEEEGLRGLDLARPVLGYAKLDGELAETAFVLVLPITAEKDFIDLLGRIGFKAEEAADAKGAHRLTPADAPLPIHLRMANGHAYVAVNGSAKTVAADALVPPADLYDPTENGLFALTVRPGRAGKAYREAALKALDEAVKEAPLDPADKGWLKALKPAAAAVATMVDRVTLRGDLDPATNFASLDLAVVPAKNSLLAAAFAARKPTTNRFATAADAKVPQALFLAFPGFTPEVAEAMAGSLAEFAGFVKMVATASGVAPLGPAGEKLVEGMAAAAKEGSLDFATMMMPSPKGDRLTSGFAVRVGNAAEVEKALRIAAGQIGEADAEMARRVTLEAARHAGAAIHTYDLAADLDPPARAAMGPDAKLAVACGPDAVYVAVGADAVAAVTALLDAKPGAARPLEFVANPAAMAAALRGAGMKGSVEKSLGTADAPARLAGLSVVGTAAELRMRAELSLGLVRLLLDAAASTPLFEPIP